MNETMRIGKELVQMCSARKNVDAIKKLFSDDVVSVESAEIPGMPRTMKGKEAIIGKNVWWMENHESHGEEIKGPFPHDNRFAVFFKIDVTARQTGKRFQMEEVGLYTVENGKITKEEFFYPTE